jgi:hypothetical protein
MSDEQMNQRDDGQSKKLRMDDILGKIEKGYFDRRREIS